jgi:predicted sugar kinase
MRSALDIKHGFSIKVKTEHEYKHTGFGSSSTLIAGVASAINELYGNPIDPNSLIKYLAQNHGEEIKNDDAHLQHVQCIGGGAAAGLIKAGSVILAGQSQCVAQMDIDDSYFVVIGVPRSYIPKDSAELMELELKNMDKFIETGKKYGASVAYQILHSVLPEMKNNQMKALGDVIYKYRFEYGSIDNCSFAYPPILDIAEKLKPLFLNGDVEVLSLSSVGPAFFAITKSKDKCIETFEKNDLKCIITRINNEGYQIINKNI